MESAVQTSTHQRCLWGIINEMDIDPGEAEAEAAEQRKFLA